MCPLITYCVTEFLTVFHCLIFWRFLFIQPIAPNKNTHQIQVFYITFVDLLCYQTCLVSLLTVSSSVWQTYFSSTSRKKIINTTGLHKQNFERKIVNSFLPISFNVYWVLRGGLDLAVLFTPFTSNSHNRNQVGRKICAGVLRHTPSSKVV